jgi:uncharacterized protein
VSAEPRVEDLLASIRRAIDQDTAARQVPAPPYEEGLLARGPIRDVRIAYDKPVGRHRPEPETRFVADPLNDEPEDQSVTGIGSPPRYEQTPPIKARSTTGFAEILAGRTDAVPVAPRRRRLDATPIQMPVPSGDPEPPQYLRKLSEHELQGLNERHDELDEWQDDFTSDAADDASAYDQVSDQYSGELARPAPLPTVNPYAPPLAAHGAYQAPQYQAEPQPQYQPDPTPQAGYSQPSRPSAFATGFPGPHSSSHGRPHAPPPALLSDHAEQSARRSFDELANTVMSRALHGRDLEDMTRDMLRAYLSRWLDEHLPPLVERIVREEIERVARRGG